MITVIASAVAIVILTALSWTKFLPDWLDDIPGKVTSWRTSLVIGAVLGIATPFLLNHFFDTITPYDFRVYPIALLVWVTPLVCVTDFTIYKISKKVTDAMILALLPNFIYLFIVAPMTGLMGLALMFIPILLFLFVMGLGMGDIKLIAAFSLGLSWLTYREWGFGLLGMAAVSIISAIIMLLLGKKLKKYEKEENLVSQAISGKKAERVETVAKRAAQATEDDTLRFNLDVEKGTSSIEGARAILSNEPPRSEAFVTQVEGLTITSDTDLFDATTSSKKGDDTVNTVDLEDTETPEEKAERLAEEEELRIADAKIAAYYARQAADRQVVIDRKEAAESKEKNKKKRYATPAGPGFLIGFIAAGVWYISQFGQYLPAHFFEVM